MSNNQVANIHPTIEKEADWLDRSVQMAETAFDGIVTGAAEAKACNVMLGAGRVLQSAARGRLQQRLNAGKLAMQEARLIDQTSESSDGEEKNKRIGQQKDAA